MIHGLCYHKLICKKMLWTARSKARKEFQQFALFFLLFFLLPPFWPFLFLYTLAKRFSCRHIGPFTFTSKIPNPFLLVFRFKHKWSSEWSGFRLVLHIITLDDPVELSRPQLFLLCYAFEYICHISSILDYNILFRNFHLGLAWNSVLLVDFLLVRQLHTWGDQSLPFWILHNYLHFITSNTLLWCSKGFKCLLICIIVM